MVPGIIQVRVAIACRMKYSHSTAFLNLLPDSRRRSGPVTHQPSSRPRHNAGGRWANAISAHIQVSPDDWVSSREPGRQSCEEYHI